MNIPQKFTAYLSQNKIPWDDEKAHLFQRFFKYLVEVNERLNLTRITDEEEVYIKHFLDSLSILSLPIPFKGKTLCDVGSGGGFPGIPLAIIYPDLKVTSVESTGKKVDFQKSLIKALALDNVTPMHERVEDLPIDAKFDYASSRAVARLSILIELTYSLVKVGGAMIFLKGPKYVQELEGSEPTFKKMGLKLETYPIEIDENERMILLIHKIHEYQLKKRPYGAIKKSPLW